MLMKNFLIPHFYITFSTRQQKMKIVSLYIMYRCNWFPLVFYVSYVSNTLSLVLEIFQYIENIFNFFKSNLKLSRNLLVMGYFCFECHCSLI